MVEHRLVVEVGEGGRWYYQGQQLHGDCGPRWPGHQLVAGPRTTPPPPDPDPPYTGHRGTRGTGVQGHRGTGA